MHSPIQIAQIAQIAQTAIIVLPQFVLMLAMPVGFNQIQPLGPGFAERTCRTIVPMIYGGGASRKHNNTKVNHPLCRTAPAI